MTRRKPARLILLGFLLSGLLGSVWTPVSASNFDGSIPTVITLDYRGAFDLGEDIILSGRLMSVYDRPIAGKPVLFTLGEEYLGQARSDENGYFERKLRNEWNAGSYDITATTNATATLAASSTSISVRILPAEVRVQTIPAIAGVSLELDGRRFLTEADGSAVTKVGEIGQHQLRILAEEYEAPDRRLEFGRWLEESFEPVKTIDVPDDDVIQVGLNVFHLVEQSFVDPEGNPVDDRRITSFKIRSDKGDVFEFTDGKPRWIPASRVVRRSNGLEQTKLLYSVINVIVNGSNVVNQSQQRFYTHAGDTWTISLLFYSMSVSARDSLFGNPVGSSVSLEFPDGSVREYPLDTNGTVEIESLPRGLYKIDILGITGISNRTPVALSRDQEVQTKVITNVDIVVAGLLGVFLCVGLLLYGRPWLVPDLLRKKPALEREAMVGSSGSVRHEEASPRTKLRLQRLVSVGSETYTHVLGLLKERWVAVRRSAKLSQKQQLVTSVIDASGEQTREQLGRIYRASMSAVRRATEKAKTTVGRLSTSRFPLGNGQTNEINGTGPTQQVEEAVDQDV